MTQVQTMPARDSRSPAIRVRRLWHRYGRDVVLKDVSFEVGRGEIFGFIGPNGAGKTTTIRVMATLLQPMAGRVEIEGHDVATEPEQVRALIGYMPDYTGAYRRLTATEYLEFFAAAHGVHDPQVVQKSLGLAGLTAAAGQRVFTLSKGMRQRLELARVMLHDPSVLILDEPASDLDPRGRIDMKNLVMHWRNLGKTIFLSSHILAELSELCTSVGILDQGRLIASGSVADIQRQLSRRSQATGGQKWSSEQLGISRRQRLRLHVLGDSSAVPPLLSGLASVGAVEVLPEGRLLIEHFSDERSIADIVARLATAGIGVVGIEPERNQLENLFLQMTERSDRS